MKAKGTKFLVFGIILLLAGCIQPANTLTSGKNPTEYEKDWMLDGYAAQHEKTREQAEKFFQQTYGINSEKDIAKKLPKRTEKFEKDKQKIMAGSGEELAAISRENYLQPDFYDTFETTGKKTWTNAPDLQLETVGLFSTPAEQEATLEKNSTTFETYLFVGSAWGATQFQGVGFFAVTEPQAPIVFEIDPPATLAGPSFPILDEQWTNRIRIRGEITGNISPGKYIITIKAVNPTYEKQEEWANAHARYVNADTSFMDPKGLATLTLNVTE